MSPASPSSSHFDGSYASPADRSNSPSMLVNLVVVESMSPEGTRHLSALRWAGQPFPLRRQRDLRDGHARPCRFPSLRPGGQPPGPPGVFKASLRCPMAWRKHGLRQHGPRHHRTPESCLRKPRGAAASSLARAAAHLSQLAGRAAPLHTRSPSPGTTCAPEHLFGPFRAEGSRTGTPRRGGWRFAGGAASGWACLRMGPEGVPGSPGVVRGGRPVAAPTVPGPLRGPPPRPTVSGGCAPG